MGALIEHAALVLAVVALGAAGLRLASAAGATGLPRPVAAAVAAVAAAVLEALALGRAGLGGSAPALLIAALATWGAARVLLRVEGAGVADDLGSRSARPADDLGRCWHTAGPAARAAAGAAAALALGWVAWQLRHPYVGADGVTYHLPLAAEYLRTGGGALTPVLDGLPVENYPVTNEVALSWALGLSGSWVAASVWAPAFAVLLVAAGRLGLGELRVPARTAWLALAALGTLPVVATQLGAPNTDVPALTWLVVAAALAAASRRNPRLLAFALVAAGLSFGTKTTGAVVLLAAVGGAAWVARGALRARAGALGAAALAAVGVGGIWALRNTALHGSPLWPLVATSFGDPVPASLAPFEASFLSHPRAMLDGRVRDYLEVLGGGAVLLAAGLAAPMLGRSRAAVAAGALVAITAFAWTVAPYTGIASDTALAVGAVRYLLPCLATCCVALCLAGRDGGPPARVAVDVVLAVAVLASLARTVRFGFPLVPGVGTVATLVGFGALAGAATTRLGGRTEREGDPPAAGGPPRAANPPPKGDPPRAAHPPAGDPPRAADPPPAGRRPLHLLRSALVRRALAVVAGVLAAAGLALGAQGYLTRHVALGLGDRGLLAAALARPEYAGGRFPIAMTPVMNALLAGDRLAHPVTLIERRTPCGEVRRRRRAGWVVLQRRPDTPEYRRLAGCLRGDRVAYADATYELHAG